MSHEIRDEVAEVMTDLGLPLHYGSAAHHRIERFMEESNANGLKNAFDQVDKIRVPKADKCPLSVAGMTPQVAFVDGHKLARDDLKQAIKSWRIEAERRAERLKK